MKLTTKLSTGGRLVLPKALVRARRWTAGMELIIEDWEEGILLKPRAHARGRTWESIVGCAHYRGPRKSLKEMAETPAAEAGSHK